MDPLPEPWLRGPVADVHPVIGAVLHSYAQAREDLAAAVAGLTPAQVWARPLGLTPAGFHLRHIARSIDRLTTYLEGRPLSPGQLDALTRENEPGEPAEALLAEVTAAMLASEGVLRKLDPASFAELRQVGRRQLPASAGGLVVHLAEHTQRHAGQTIAAARLARAMSA